jgi:DNA-binding CsgD family transcriptional regulator
VYRPLTDTQGHILLGLAGGLQSKEIAQRVGRSKATIESHIRILFATFAARSRAELVARAFELGYLEIRDGRIEAHRPGGLLSSTRSKLLSASERASRP